MSRRKLSIEEKEGMQRARREASEKRQAARAALESNPQFTNPTFWKQLDTNLFNSIEGALREAGRARRQDKIKAVERELARMRG